MNAKVRRLFESRSLWLGIVSAAALAVLLVWQPDGYWYPGAAGLAAAMGLGSLVGPLCRWASAGWNTTPPYSALTSDSGESGERQRVKLLSEDKTAGPFVLGAAEVLLFYIAVLAGHPEIIVGWLVFKTGAKWAVWQHIMLMPQKLDQVDDVDFVRYRHAFSSKLATSFLVGTIANVLAAFGGIGVLLMLGGALPG